MTVISSFSIKDEAKKFHADFFVFDFLFFYFVFCGILLLKMIDRIEHKKISD